MITTVKEKKVEVEQIDEEEVVSDACPTFDEKDCTITESMANMVEGCCLFKYFWKSKR